MVVSRHSLRSGHVSPPVGASSCAFDLLQRRKSKTVSGTATLYLSAGDQEIAEYDGSGNLLRRSVYGASLDETVAVVTPSGQKSYFQAHALGSTIALTNGTGMVSDRLWTTNSASQ